MPAASVSAQIRVGAFSDEEVDENGDENVAASVPQNAITIANGVTSAPIVPAKT